MNPNEYFDCEICKKESPHEGIGECEECGRFVCDKCMGKLDKVNHYCSECWGGNE